MPPKRVRVAEVTSSTAKKPCREPWKQNWQAGLKTTMDRLTEIYKSSRFTDLTISFPESGEKLKVHRLMLAMISPVFECIFYGPMAVGNELELPEDPIDPFKWLLQYIYCGITDFPDVSSALQVCLLADKYQIDDVSLLCSQYLQERLDEDTLPHIHPTASVIEDKDLLQECDMIITYSSELMLSSPSIGLLSRENMKNFMERELTVSSEVAVYNGLIKWGRAQVSQANDQAESKGLREIVNEFLPFVNFLSMSLDEFVEHVGPSNIITPNESLAILMSIKKVKNIPLPEFCTQVGRRHTWCIHEAHTVSLATLKSNAFRGFRHRESVFSGHQMIPEHVGQVISLHQMIAVAEHFEPVGLPYRPQIIAEHIEPAPSRRQIIAEHVEPVFSRRQISNLKINKSICLHSIDLCFGFSVELSNWVIEVTYSSGRVIGKGKLNHICKADSKSINASFTPPLLLRPRKLYNIWIHSTLSISDSKEFCVEHGDLKFTGSIRQEVGAKIQFGVFKESPNDVSDCNGGDNGDDNVDD